MSRAENSRERHAGYLLKSVSVADFARRNGAMQARFAQQLDFLTAQKRIAVQIRKRELGSHRSDFGEGIEPDEDETDARFAV